ncbi:hypothetical protein [Sulfobacillus sp. hq2]|uniref:hypothetical protein n=1 Tax=Sulfobacillus sp. hq2 TaxID=2039167 RepID=UPI0011AFC33F|nr:hypothetical protein [Sulfobacillus sp. hq2]
MGELMGPKRGMTTPPVFTFAVCGFRHLSIEYPSSQVTEGVRVAQHINTYLQTTSLPVPSTQGWVVANLSEQIVNMQVSWDHNALTFLTSSTGPWNSNLSGGYLSALDMATHIQKN